MAEDSDDDSLASALIGCAEEEPARIKTQPPHADFPDPPAQAFDKMRAGFADFSSRFGSTFEVLGTRVNGAVQKTTERPTQNTSAIRAKKPAEDNFPPDVDEDDDLRTWSEDAPFREEVQTNFQTQARPPIQGETGRNRQSDPEIADSWSRMYQQGRQAMENASRKLKEKGAEVSASLDQKFNPPERTLPDEGNRLSRDACRPSREACSAPRWPAVKSRPRASTASSVSSNEQPDATERALTNDGLSTFGAVTRAVMAGRRNFKELKNATKEALGTLDEQYKISEKVADFDQSILDGAGENLRQRLKEHQANPETQERKKQIWSQVNKTFVKAAVKIGSPRPLFKAVDPGALCYYDASMFPGAAGCVALTIDDAPCSQSEPGQCLLKEVRELLAEFDAKATFFLCTDYVPDHEDELVETLRHGHEVGNHGGEDRAYSAETEEDFEKAFLGFEEVCKRIRRAALQSPVQLPESSSSDPAIQGETVASDVEGSDNVAASDAVETLAEPSSLDVDPSGKGDVHDVDPSRKGDVQCISDVVLQCPADVVLPQRPARWFRAPHADASPAMQKVLRRHGFTNVLCDCFANDTNITDPQFIADAMLDSLDPLGGSILVLHMPERGFREYNLETLRFLLLGLREKKMRALTVTGLTDAAWEGGIRRLQGSSSAEQPSTIVDPSCAEQPSTDVDPSL